MYILCNAILKLYNYFTINSLKRLNLIDFNF